MGEFHRPPSQSRRSVLVRVAATAAAIVTGRGFAQPPTARPQEGDPNLAAARLASGESLILPDGTTQMTGSWHLRGGRWRLRGSGPNASTLSFSPTRPAAAIEVTAREAEGPIQVQVGDIGFLSANPVDKDAIRLVNASNVTIERVGIATNAWPGSGSVGIRTAGRQFVRIRDCDIACARPIVFGPNPAFPTLATDFFTVDSCELVSTERSRACLEVTEGSVITNLRVVDTAFVRGGSGFRFVDSTSAGASYSLQFENIRSEQGMNPADWSFDIRSTRQSMQSVVFRNVRCDSARNGIRIRGGQRITLINVDIDQRPGGIALDIEFVPGTILTIIGSFRQFGSRIVLRNATRVGAAPEIAADDFRPFEQWIYAAGRNAG